MGQKKINTVTIPSSWTWNVIKLDQYYSHRQSKSYKNQEKPLYLCLYKAHRLVHHYFIQEKPLIGKVNIGHV